MVTDLRDEAAGYALRLANGESLEMILDEVRQIAKAEVEVAS